MDISTAINLLKQKKLSSKELTQTCLKKAYASGAQAYISVLEDLAMLQANDADQLYQQGKQLSPLQGIPYSLKDLFITEGVRTTAGSRALANYIPPYQGHVAEQLSKAKGVCIGKNSLDEFGMGSTNLNTPFSQTRHPLNSDYLVGGSSGGSAASVLEQSCFYSIGTDTGGSVRLPASFCGLVGFRPTYGMISRRGQIAYSSSLDQAAIVANSVLDAAQVFTVLGVPDPLDSTSYQMPVEQKVQLQQLRQTDGAGLKGLRIGYHEDFIKHCDPGVKQQLELALKKLEQAGAVLIPVTLEHVQHSIAVYYIIATAEASANLARYDGIHFGYQSSRPAKSLDDLYAASRTESLGAEVQKRILLGTFALSAGYAQEYFTKAAKVRTLIARDFAKAFDQVDIFFSPACASTAFTYQSMKELAQKDPVKVYMNDLYTVPVNLAGLTSIALPCGSSDQMPVGFQFFAASGKDQALLKAARAWESYRGEI